jgi:hypothetical protein
MALRQRRCDNKVEMGLLIRPIAQQMTEIARMMTIYFKVKDQ